MISLILIMKLNSFGFGTWLVCVPDKCVSGKKVNTGYMEFTSYFASSSVSLTNLSNCRIRSPLVHGVTPVCCTFAMVMHHCDSQFLLEKQD